jgi:large subunit ribosomal protein L21
MYAIVETGGKQYRVEEGAELNVALMGVEPGADVKLEKVLFVSDGGQVKIGAPYVSGAAVSCEVVAHGRGPKIVVFKKKRRNDSARKLGHRQDYTRIKVKSIQA